MLFTRVPRRAVLTAATVLSASAVALSVTTLTATAASVAARPATGAWPFQTAAPAGLLHGEPSVRVAAAQPSVLQVPNPWDI
jgi:hypothetical protein